MSESIRNDEVHREEGNCLFCSLLDTVRSARERNSAFYTHMYNARIEVLQAFRSLIDRRITVLEERRSCTEAKKATKIEVE